MRKKHFIIMLLALAVACLTMGCGDELGDSPAVGYPGAGDSEPLLGAELSCFYSSQSSALKPGRPAATVEHLVEVIKNDEVVHIRLTLDPNFVDNTYGANSIGWEDDKKGIHEFEKLVGSDHAQIVLTNKNGNTIFDFKIDYLSQDVTAPTGYSSLGVAEKDGEVIIGDQSAIKKTATSLDRNLNERGYGAYLSDSPQTDASYAVNQNAPDWDYRVVYEVWVLSSAFEPAGFGAASIEYIHASPSKVGENSVFVETGDCPDDWDDTCSSQDDSDDTTGDDAPPR